MAIQEQKSEVFAQVASLKVLVSDTKQKGEALWESINNISNDPIKFLTDLIKELVGYEALREGVSETLASSLNTIEDDIKYIIKLKLKEYTNCGTNPEIPNELKYENKGYDFKLNELDFNSIFKLDPASTYGSFIYNDIENNVNSIDLNTFLYYVIQNDGNEENWGEQGGFNDIISFIFNTTKNGESNILNIKASEYYTNNKKLTDLNNDYVDSVDLFPDSQFYAKILDKVFNVFNQVIQKTPAQTENEVKLDAIIDKLLAVDSDEYVDDSYFSFTNNELKEIDNKIKLRALGISELESCYKFPQITTPNNVLNEINGLNNISSYEERKTKLDNSFNKFANIAGGLGNEKDKYNIKLNFFELLIDALVKSIVNLIFSPKMLLIFLINFKIIKGSDANYSSIEELIKIMKGLFKEIIDKIKSIVVEMLLKIALKEIKKLQSQVTDKILSELISNRQKSLLSLVGVGTDIINTISKL